MTTICCARQHFIVFLETLRPCAHLFGGPLGAYGLTNPKVDPISFRLRLALTAFAFYWDPKSTPVHALSPEAEEHRRHNCPDTVKAWIKDAYCGGDEKEWTMLVRMFEVFIPGRVEYTIGSTPPFKPVHSSMHALYPRPLFGLINY